MGKVKLQKYIKLFTEAINIPILKENQGKKSPHELWAREVQKWEIKLGTYCRLILLKQTEEIINIWQSMRSTERE